MLEPAATERVPHLQRWLRIALEDKPRVYAQISHSGELSSVSYWAEILFTAGIATFGLVLNSPAVIIGAMLISPLMGPIMATGLALALGDFYLAAKGVTNLILSVGLAISLSALIVWLLPFHATTGEILARTNPTLLDLGVALFSGLAGSFAVCRSGGAEGVTTLPGVAIAVALMPPLCTVGFGLGSGVDLSIMGGAALLFLTNLVAIVSSAFLVFLLIGMDVAAVRVEMEQSHRAGPIARILMRHRWVRSLSEGGTLHWRVLMLVILLAAVAVPLRSAFEQLASEAAARGAVQEQVRKLIPRAALVSQQIEVGRDGIAVRLVSTEAIPQANLQRAEQFIQQRSGKKAEISVASIASQSELGQLMQRLATPAVATPPPPQSLDSLRQEMVAQVGPVLESEWPAETPVQSFQLDLQSTGVTVEVDYAGRSSLTGIAVGLIEKQLRDQLKMPNLNLDARRVATSSAPKQARPAKP